MTPAAIRFGESVFQRCSAVLTVLARFGVLPNRTAMTTCGEREWAITVDTHEVFRFSAFEVEPDTAGLAGTWDLGGLDAAGLTVMAANVRKARARRTS